MGDKVETKFEPKTSGIDIRINYWLSWV